MAITFDIPNTEVVMTTGQTTVTVQALVNAIRTFESQFEMMGQDHILTTSGKANLGGGVFTEIILTLRNPWTLRFVDEGSAHTSVTGGTTLALDAIGDPRPVTTNFALTINQSVSGTLVETTPADIWAHAVEGGFTAEQLLRILAAVAAGKASGLEGASPAFRDIADTKDRVAGTYSAGTRTITTRDGS